MITANALIDQLTKGDKILDQLNKELALVHSTIKLKEQKLEAMQEKLERINRLDFVILAALKELEEQLPEDKK